jgi:hypothetical protein
MASTCFPNGVTSARKFLRLVQEARQSKDRRVGVSGRDQGIGSPMASCGIDCSDMKIVWVSPDSNQNSDVFSP